LIPSALPGQWIPYSISFLQVDRYSIDVDDSKMSLIIPHSLRIRQLLLRIPSTNFVIVQIPRTNVGFSSGPAAPRKAVKDAYNIWIHNWLHFEVSKIIREENA
jgi:hypothetical protein